MVTRGIIVAHIEVEEDVALDVLGKTFAAGRIQSLSDRFHSIEEDALKRETNGAWGMTSKLTF